MIWGGSVFEILHSNHFHN